MFYYLWFIIHVFYYNIYIYSCQPTNLQYFRKYFFIRIYPFKRYFRKYFLFAYILANDISASIFSLQLSTRQRRVDSCKEKIFKQHFFFIFNIKISFEMKNYIFLFILIYSVKSFCRISFYSAYYIVKWVMA